ncbi:MAG: deoxyribose-phosphate aldolase [Proteobacteria bacterium]|nr:deoxyribose-phosphate aldolase [Pseudomonadota bacterium]
MNKIALSIQEFAKYFDHTALKPETTRADIQKLCEEAKQLCVAAVCVNPIWIGMARELLNGSGVMAITVVGFPLGASETDTKVFETRNAVARGAQEIDMVISIGQWKAEEHDLVRKDIYEVHKACRGVPLKVIFETSLLQPQDIHKLSTWCAEDGIEFVKTSTGFGSRGATIEDIKVMSRAIKAVGGAKTKIKASGGIKTLADALGMIEAGAQRIGASATVTMVREYSEQYN